MWAAPPCIPHTQFTITNPTAMCRLPAGVSKKFQLHSHLDLNTGSITDKQRGEQVVEKQEKTLSGFDVLRALEKATAQKMKKRRNGRDNSLSSKKVTAEDEDLADYGSKNVRSLSIKEDWGSRLDELERRLEELVDIGAA